MSDLPKIEPGSKHTILVIGGLRAVEVKRLYGRGRNRSVVYRWQSDEPAFERFLQLRLFQQRVLDAR